MKMCTLYFTLAVLLLKYCSKIKPKLIQQWDVMWPSLQYQNYVC